MYKLDSIKMKNSLPIKENINTVPIKKIHQRFFSSKQEEAGAHL